jgi:hypothetical protein
MIVKRIDNRKITDTDINLYKMKISESNNMVHTANDFGIDARIVSIKIPIDTDDTLILVNPEFTEKSNDMILYYEYDSYKPNKIRKTIRHKSVIVNTDNLGLVEFKPTNEKGVWETSSDFFKDVGLLECVLIQRAIDSINGIDITDPTRIYKNIAKSERVYGRNDKVMLQSPDGADMIFIKYKLANSYIERGYKIV